MKLYVFIKSIPVIRALLPFVIGIVIGIDRSLSALCLQYVIIALVIISVILFILNPYIIKPTLSPLKGSLISFIFFIAGFLLSAIQPSDFLIPEEKPHGYWLCRVNDFPVEKNKSYRVTISPDGFYDTVYQTQDSFSMFLYLRKDSLSNSLKPGDIIMVNMQPVRPVQHGNPHEFDYRRYLFRKQIYYQAFVEADEWFFFRKDVNRLKYIPLKIQYEFVKRVRGIINSYESFGIVSALAVGTRNFIDEETKLAYSDAGAMHVLAVSGLHVGLVWYVLSVIFGHLKNSLYTRFLYWVIMTSLLWMYVMITGMSPSVTRAGIMLTLVVTSAMLRRGSSTANPVFFSAFILLAINPYLLLDVGFQFSYLAVFGILFFQPRLKSLMEFKNPILKYIWELGTVSVAAQTGTIIPSLYYFNKFPSYFLLTNFIVIPLVTIILLCIISSVFFWYFDPVFVLISKCGGYFTGLMNRGVKFIESLPGSSVKQIYIDNVDVLILTLALLFLMFFIYGKRVQFLLLCFLFLTTFFVYGGIRDHNRRKRSFAIVHNIPGVLALNLYAGGSHYFISSGLSEEILAQISRSCSNFWLYERVRNPVFIDIGRPLIPTPGMQIIPVRNTGNHFILFNNRTFVLINNLKEIKNYSSNSKIITDFLLFNNVGAATKPVFTSLSEESAVIFSSVSKWRHGDDGILKVEEDTFKVHEVIKDGAFLKYLR